jgi:adenosylcobinamide kinase/adenosylcobinamide-phosphate guanylyltransferase
VTPAAPGPLLSGVLLLGGAARPFPVDGCGCLTCAEGAGDLAGLAVGRGLVLDGAGPAPEGAVHLASGALPPAAGARPLAVGDAVTAGPLRAVALPGPAGSPDAVCVVVSDGTSTLLWAPGRGPLPDETLDALGGAGLAVVAVDVRDPAGTGSATAAAHRLADLRRAGAVGADVRVVAVGHDHEGPATGRLTESLAVHGIRLARGGERTASLRPFAQSPAVRRTLVLGPASSGKSAVAEHLLAARPEVVYAATGPAPDGTDADWAARVTAHRDRRPRGWTTVEASAPGALAALLGTPGPPVLLDSLGTWVAAALDRAGAWADDETGAAAGWRDAVAAEGDALLAAWRGTRRDVVAVGEEVGWGVVPATRSGRLFAETLGDLTRRLADASERAVLVVAGRTVDLAAATPTSDPTHDPTPDPGGPR